MKRWVFFVLFLFVIFYTTLTFISSQVTFPLISSLSSVSKLKYYDYSGVTHVHSKLSTGSGTIDEIAQAASLANCDFLILTDLNVGQKPEFVEGYKDDVAVIWAGEFSYLGGHLLAYDLPETESFKGLGQAQIIFNDLLHQKPRPSSQGFLIASHPNLPQHTWGNLNDSGLTGMEVINLDSLWRDEIVSNKLSILWSILILPFNPDLSYLRLFNDPEKELSAWDEILKTRSFVGVGGSDATANAIPWPNESFKFPSYTQSFSLMKNHLLLKSELTGSYKSDRTKIMSALAQGNFYFSVDIIGDPTGFYFIGQQRRQEWLPGSTVSRSNGPIRFVVELGRQIELPHEIILYRNGVKVGISNSHRLEYTADQAGAYRVTVRVIPTLPLPDGKTWYTWIFSNAIRVE